MNDPYATLGLQRGASDEEVEKAYKKLAKQHHPDLNPGNKEAEERFKAINAARDQIKNPQPQGNGFPNGHPGQQGGWSFHFGGGNGGPFTNLDEIMAAMHAQQFKRNRDVTVECHISLEDAFRGTEINVNLRDQNGTRNIAVKIPAGIDNGNRIRVPQAGDNSFPSMTPGDLYVMVHVQPHTRFQRQNKNLHAIVEVDVFDVLLGGTIGSFQVIDGTNIDVKIPTNFNPSTHLRIPGMGMPSHDSAVRGDLLISVRVKYPELSDAQRNLISDARKLSKTSTETE